MSSFKRNALNLILLTQFLTANANHITLSTPICDDSLPVTLTAATGTCGDYGCDWSDEASITAKVKLYNFPDLEGDDDDDAGNPTTLTVNLTAPFNTWSGDLQSYEIDLCDNIVSTDDDDGDDDGDGEAAECPDDGTYALSESVTLPDQPSKYLSSWAMTGWTVSVGMNLEDSKGVKLMSCIVKATLSPAAANDEANANYRYTHPSAQDSVFVFFGFVGLAIIVMVIVKLVQGNSSSVDESPSNYKNMNEPVDEIMMQRSTSYNSKNNAMV